MNKPVFPDIRIDRSIFSVASTSDESDEKEYWAARTPQERLAAVELMRQINDGYDPVTDRLQRVLEIAELKSCKDRDDLEHLP